MTDATQGGPARWSSHLGFILTAAGAAVGLGNIWRFPYIAGENGGGAFVLVYLLAVAAIGFPVMVAELWMGRHGGANAYATVSRLRREFGAGRAWQAIGWLSLLLPFVGIGYYSVVARRPPRQRRAARAISMPCSPRPCGCSSFTPCSWEA